MTWLDAKRLEQFGQALRQRRAAFLREADDAEEEIGELEAQSDESELEERSQQERNVRLLDRLDDRGRRGVEAIERALDRIANGTYGRCVDCGARIPIARLEALPEAERCVQHAEAAEHRPQTHGIGTASPPRADVVDLDDQELTEEVWDTLRTDDRLDLEELEVAVRKGTVHLSGTLPSDAQRAIVEKTVTDMLGGRNVIVEVRVEPLAWQRADRTPGLEPERLPEYETSEADPRDAGKDESEDVTETNDDGRGYNAPERPLPDEEPE